MKTYWGQEVQLHAFHTFGPYGVERSASWPSHFTPFYTLQQILIGWSSVGRWGGRGMQFAWYM